MHKKIIIIGAGAAGIGVGIVLKKMKLDFLILEKGLIGESFRHWPPGTKFISPSFTGNFFGSPDLNAICPDTSPAFQLNTEHPSGDEYAFYLETLARFYDLPIYEKRKVVSLTKEGSTFTISTNKRDFTADAIIWAGGEYQFPKTKVCLGAELAIHNTQVSDWRELKGDVFPIVGGYESAFDTAIQLAKLKKKSVVFDSQNHLDETRSDSSFSLSPYTKDRLLKYHKYITIRPNSRIKKITKKQGSYIMTTVSDQIFDFKAQPILATGFQTSLVMVKDFFDWDDGVPCLTLNDESTKVNNFFLVGPQVQHGQIIFCFVYKFRQRFAVVAEQISKSLRIGDENLVREVIIDYKQKNFYLNNLSCCGDECAC